MKPETVKSELQKVIEKYKLPALENLDSELELVDMLAERNELPKNMVAAIRRRLTEVIYSWINFTHSLIVPNPQSIIVNKDSEAFDDKQKEEIYKVMAALAKMTRESTGFEAMRNKEKEEANFITQSFEKYMELKPRLAGINEKVVSYWQKEISALK